MEHRQKTGVKHLNAYAPNVGLKICFPVLRYNPDKTDSFGFADIPNSADIPDLPDSENLHNLLRILFYSVNNGVE